MLGKYKWYLIVSLAIVAVFVVTGVWMYFVTDSPQAEPFKYQVF